MEREIVNFYEQLYSGSGRFRPKLGGISLFSIPLKKPTFLEANFTVEEIRVVVESLSCDRAPGLDRFPISFFQQF